MFCWHCQYSMWVGPPQGYITTAGNNETATWSISHLNEIPWGRLTLPMTPKEIVLRNNSNKVVCRKTSYQQEITHSFISMSNVHFMSDDPMKVLLRTWDNSVLYLNPCQKSNWQCLCWKETLKVKNVTLASHIERIKAISVGIIDYGW